MGREYHILSGDFMCIKTEMKVEATGDFDFSQDFLFQVIILRASTDTELPEGPTDHCFLGHLSEDRALVTMDVHNSFTKHTWERLGGVAQSQV